MMILLLLEEKKIRYEIRLEVSCFFSTPPTQSSVMQM